MREFMNDLKEMHGKIPKNTIKTLRGQALSGDVDGARRGLEKIKNRSVKQDDYISSK
jgi:hypothetical protein